VVLKPTDRLLLRCCCHPLAFIAAERQDKKKGEKTSSFDGVTVFLLTIFSVYPLLLFLAHDLWYCNPHTVFCAAIVTTHSRSCQQSGNTIRRVRKHQVSTMLQFFTHHV
jgi:hypothetical protein